ncbi:MAG: hypothetical protein ABI689_08430 [Thermoanaerobaculia bacterium]
MENKMARLALLALLGLTAAAALAQGHPHAPEPGPANESATPPPPAGGVSALSPDLRALFRLEMAGLQGAMLELLPAVVSGDWEKVENVAERIRSGFVLAQKLTEAQREELDGALPAGFLERDAEFHEMATGLAAAAREHQPELVSFYVYKLTDGCIGCHTRHAQARFPGFASAAAPAAHAH